MNISKSFISESAQELINNNESAKQAYLEVCNSIYSIITDNYGIFIINNSEKHCNGVVPIKDKFYSKLEDEFNWFREKPLLYLKEEMKKGGPIDVYKELSNFKVGMEFETGNISSAHRSVNKLQIGLMENELDLAIIIMPVYKLSYYLTDRISNYEELEPYLKLLNNLPFIVLGFDADEYSQEVPTLPKGKDGMSNRSKRKW